MFKTLPQWWTDDYNFSKLLQGGASGIQGALRPILDLPARQIPGLSESIVILSGQSLIEKFMARLSQWSLNCQSWQHRAEACTELQLSRRKWTKSFRAALQNLWLDHNCPSKYTLSQEHSAQVSLWANLNACVPCSSTLPTCLHPSLWEFFVSKMHHL